MAPHPVTKCAGRCCRLPFFMPAMLRPEYQMKRLNRKQAAEYLGVSPNTLARWAWIKSPSIPYYRLGQKTVYDQDDLDRFLAKNRVDADNAAVEG